MLIPVLPLPLTLLIAAADGVPNWDMNSSCRGAASSGFAKAENANERLPILPPSERSVSDQ